MSNRNEKNDENSDESQREMIASLLEKLKSVKEIRFHGSVQKNSTSYVTNTGEKIEMPYYVQTYPLCEDDSN